jgi:hypothetical protein
MGDAGNNVRPPSGCRWFPQAAPCPVSDKLKFVGPGGCIFIRRGVPQHMGDAGQNVRQPEGCRWLPQAASCPVSDKLKFVGPSGCIFIVRGVLLHMGDFSVNWPQLMKTLKRLLPIYVFLYQEVQVPKSTLQPKSLTSCCGFLISCERLPWRL